MRVVWVPPQELAAFYEGREDLVLAGRTGLENVGDEHELGQVGDGWGDKLNTLEVFPWDHLGIKVSHV